MLHSSMLLKLGALRLTTRTFSTYSSSLLFYKTVPCSLLAVRSPKESSLQFKKSSIIPVNLTRCLSGQDSKQRDEKKETSQSEPMQDSTTNKNLTTKERLKIITTQYGAFGMAFHITISLASLGMFYFLVYSGVDFLPLMTWLGMENSKFATGASTFVIAYAVHKVFAPVRIGITFVSVPVLVKHFRKIGFFKR